MITPSTKLQQLRITKTGHPEHMGRNFKVVRHANAIDTMKEAIEGQGWGAGRVLISVSPDKMDMVSVAEIYSHGNLLTPGYAFWLGSLSCNSRRRSSRYFGCMSYNDVGMVFFKYPRYLHTLHVDLPALAIDAVERISENMGEMKAIVEDIRATKLTKEMMDHVVVEGLRKKIVHPHRFLKMIPFMTKCETLFDLYMAYSGMLLQGPSITNAIRWDHLSLLFDFYRLICPQEVEV